MNRFHSKRKLSLQVVVALLIALPLVNCHHPTSSKSSEFTLDLERMELLADTITYTVVVKNRDTTDTWADQRLGRLDHKRLVDDLFEAIYEHEATPYDYYTHQPLSIRDIKKLEKQEDFSRDRVGQLQFCEAWYMDPQTQQMHKQVHSVLVAYEYYLSTGELRGYKAAFYIKMNNTNSKTE